METAVFKKAMREQQELLGPDADPIEVRDAAYASVAESKTMRTLARNQGQLRRAYEKACKELRIMQADRIDPENKTNPPISRRPCSKSSVPRRHPI